MREGGGVEARRGPGGAVNVDGVAAGPAHEVVVVVADSVLEPSRVAGGLDAADQAGLGQGGQDVVHRLEGDLAEPVGDLVVDPIGGEVVTA